jgi:hypothetical protein
VKKRQSLTVREAEAMLAAHVDIMRHILQHQSQDSFRVRTRLLNTNVRSNFRVTIVAIRQPEIELDRRSEVQPHQISVQAHRARKFS